MRCSMARGDGRNGEHQHACVGSCLQAAPAARGGCAAPAMQLTRGGCRGGLLRCGRQQQRHGDTHGVIHFWFDKMRKCTVLRELGCKASLGSRGHWQARRLGLDAEAGCGTCKDRIVSGLTHA